VLAAGRRYRRGAACACNRIGREPLIHSPIHPADRLADQALMLCDPPDWPPPPCTTGVGNGGGTGVGAGADCNAGAGAGACVRVGRDAVAGAAIAPDGAVDAVDGPEAVAMPPL